MTETSNGHQVWNDWFLDYGVFGTEGLSLVNGFFRGQKVFNKLSLPVIRVKYVQDEFFGGLSSVFGVGCGPYNDQITWDPENFGENLNPIAGPHHLVKMDGRYIRIVETILDAMPALELGVYARIGAYHIYQAWYLFNDGMLKPRVFSKGLSCNLDHWHHPYWRFDFALGSPESHRVAVFEENGGHLADITTEGGFVNGTFSRMPEYHVTATNPAPTEGTIRTPARAIIVPPHLDEAEGIVGPTPFAPMDGYIRKFRPAEDMSWPHPPAEDMGFLLHQPCDDSDIVFWEICHLHHHASEGADHWHSVGPDLFFEPMVVANIPPRCLRVVEISGEIHVKDFKLAVTDDWQHATFTGKVQVNPNMQVQEIAEKLVSGDVTGEIVIRVTWNPDSSVNVSFVARLFDEAERVAEATGQFNVLRDGAMSWGGIHLVDHHSGDPDTADMAFSVDNHEQ